TPQSSLLYAHLFPSSFFILPLPPTSTLFPYTTLFRSHPHSRQRYLPAHQFQRERLPPPRPALRSPESAQRFEVRVEAAVGVHARSEEHTSELQSPYDLVCRLLLEKKKITRNKHNQMIK